MRRVRAKNKFGVPGEKRKGFVQPALFLEDHAEMFITLGITWRKTDGLSVAGLGLRKLALLAQGVPQRIVTLRRSRTETHCICSSGFGLQNLARLKQTGRKIDMGVGIAGCQTDGGVECGLRLVRAVKLVQIGRASCRERVLRLV